MRNGFLIRQLLRFRFRYLYKNVEYDSCAVARLNGVTIDIEVQDEKSEIMPAAGDRKRGTFAATHDRVSEFVTPPAELVSTKQGHNCPQIIDEAMLRTTNVCVNTR